MSLASGIFTFPWEFVLNFYNMMYFNLPLYQESQLGLERIHKTDSRYAQLLSTLPGSQIKNEMQPFLNEAGIRGDLIFVETPNQGACSASGTNMFRNGDAVIMVDPDLHEADKDACNWAIMHEISHIKCNDTLTMQCVPGVCQLAASIFGMCYLSFLPALAVASMAGFVSRALFSQWREGEADDFAIKNSSNEELRGGRRFLIAAQKKNIEERNTFWKRITISCGGDPRIPQSHPSFISRIKKIENALRDRGIDISAEEEEYELVIN